MKKRITIKSKGVVWHIYHSILAFELALIIAIEFTELMMNL
jgi:hypothetical protein|tara:strand:- start:14 stop:136 length:123 start_codon:yes stop_codon:yes gene_type:complete